MKDKIHHNSMVDRRRLSDAEQAPYFHVHSSIKSMVSIWAEKCKQNQTQISCVCDDALPAFLPFDSLRLQHCLNNLISNAAKYTYAGTIKIIASQLTRQNANGDTQTFVVLSVQDDGHGIPFTRQPELFSQSSEPSIAAAQSYGVIKTNLADTKVLIEDIGGRILLRSDEGAGSTFSIVLPLKASNPHAMQTPKACKYSSHDFKDLQILVVDDYNLNQVTIKALLYDTVRKVHYAGNGYEALGVLHSCPVDIVLMDIHMPIMDGIEATMRIRESQQTWNNVYIAALSGDPQYQHAHLCRKIGMDNALAKPIRKDQLLGLFSEYQTARSLRAAG